MNYRHFRAPWFDFDGGAATVAFDEQMGLAGVAVCSPNDQFSKRAGRLIAEQRIIDLMEELGIDHNGSVIAVPPLRTQSAELTRALEWLMGVFLTAHGSDVHIYQVALPHKEEKDERVAS